MRINKYASYPNKNHGRMLATQPLLRHVDNKSTFTIRTGRMIARCFLGTSTSRASYPECGSLQPRYLLCMYTMPSSPNTTCMTQVLIQIQVKDWFKLVPALHGRILNVVGVYVVLWLGILISLSLSSSWSPFSRRQSQATISNIYLLSAVMLS